MRIALAQINTTMGAVEKNCQKISTFLLKAKSKGVDLTVFPELSILGYPPQDFIEQKGFVQRSGEALHRLAQEHKDQSFIVGFVDVGPPVGKGRFNAAALIENGRVRFVQNKEFLPTYDVFDESRYFDSGKSHEIVRIGNRNVGITICEDIWTDETLLGRKLYAGFPAKKLQEKGAELVINISASPYHEGKEEIRKKLTTNLVLQLKLPLIFVNLVGGNDEILFDGGSFALNSKGKVIGRCHVFKEDFVTIELDSEDGGEIHDWPKEPEEWKAQALCMGIDDYVKKCGFSDVVIGLSGGIDSSLTALLAVRALGASHVTGLLMPSPYTSSASLEDAKALAQNLGIQSHVLPIEALMRAYEETLAQVFVGKAKDKTEENIQARIRGNLLMALSNKFGSLVLSTGNKSELAVGYCTQYGDMAGGLAVISDVPKTEVYKLAAHLNKKWKAIPKRVFERAPSAELRPDQRDQDSLPPYEVLDPILRLHIEEALDEDSIVKQGFDRTLVQKVISMVEKNEFKRRQAAPGLRLSPKAFGVGRRMPIAKGGQ